jgi:CRP-like cAMP-binding protein
MSTSTGITLFRHAEDVEMYQAGETVFSAGDAGDRMYAVQSGCIDLIIGGRVVETVSEGGVFGEMSLIDGSARSATATAREASALVPITEQRFQFLTQQTPRFALEVMRVMARRLREANAATSA